MRLPQVHELDWNSDNKTCPVGTDPGVLKMQWAGPHEGKEQDAIILHCEWGNSTGVPAGTAVMFNNGDTPFFADRRLSVNAAYTVDLDLTGYRITPTENHASIETSICCGILTQAVSDRPVSTFNTHTPPPVQALAYGVIDTVVNFTGNVAAYTPVMPDDANTGELRNFIAPTGAGATYVPNDAPEQFRICGYITKDWAGGAAAGTVKIFARCLG